MGRRGGLQPHPVTDAENQSNGHVRVTPGAPKKDQEAPEPKEVIEVNDMFASLQETPSFAQILRKPVPKETHVSSLAKAAATPGQTPTSTQSTLSEGFFVKRDVTNKPPPQPEPSEADSDSSSDIMLADLKHQKFFDPNMAVESYANFEEAAKVNGSSTSPPSVTTHFALPPELMEANDESKETQSEAGSKEVETTQPMDTSFLFPSSNANPPRRVTIDNTVLRSFDSDDSTIDPIGDHQDAADLFDPTAFTKAGPSRRR